MDCKHIEVDKKYHIEKKNHMFLTMALCPVPAFVMAPHNIVVCLTLMDKPLQYYS